MNTFKPNLGQRARLLFSPQFALAFSAVVPGLTFYGGATVTAAHDATGAEYMVACAKDNQSGLFGLYALRGDNPVLIRPVSGRGSVWVSLLDGKGRWIGWEGSTRQGGEIPGFVPLAFGGAARPPVPIPPGGAISQLFQGTYAAVDFDTPAETALRVNKLLAGVNELVALLKQAGVLV